MTIVIKYLICLFLLFGCAPQPDEIDSDGYEWHYVLPPIPEHRWKYTYVRDISDLCRISRESCALRRLDPKDGLMSCEIVLPKKAPLKYIEHEEKHCQGGVHNQLEKSE